MVRVKRRYIVLKIKYKKSNLKPESFTNELRERIIQSYGDFGIACLNRGYSIKKYIPEAGYLILCVRKGVHEMVMSVIPLIVTIDQVPCSVSIFHLSGTMRASLSVLKLDYIRNVRESIAPKIVKSSHTSVEIYKAPKKKDCDKNKKVKSKADKGKPKPPIVSEVIELDNKD